jgi:hypothetical protein
LDWHVLTRSVGAAIGGALLAIIAFVCVFTRLTAAGITASQRIHAARATNT